jgi:GT2 family glycosyltransferase
MPRISVVVCTLNREEELEEFLGTLRRQTFQDYELLIVSNRKLDIKGARSFVQNGRGLPNARNRVLDEVRGDIVIFFDDDVLLAKHYLEEIVDMFEENPGIGGMTGRITNSVDPDIKRGILSMIANAYGRIFGISGFFANLPGTGKVLPTGFTCSNFNSEWGSEVEWLSGCNMCYSREALKSNGRFDEGLIGNAYYEDTDFSYRVFRRGYRLLYNPRARLKHMVTPTSRVSLAKLKYNQIINQKRFFERNVGGRLGFFRNRLAHAALALPIAAYSAYSMNGELIRNYIYAELGWKL